MLVETDGTLVTETLADKILVALKNAPARAVKKSAVTWIVMLDAFSEEKYSSIRHGGNFAAAVNAVQILGRRFPSCVYPQFTRVNENEDELEKFYRFWHEKDSPSGGKLIVKKYDSCCAVLPDRKPADLSPLERCPCWHLRRDMIVLCDGSVPLCQECIGEEPAGNVFEEGVQSVWNKIELSSDGTSVSKKINVVNAMNTIPLIFNERHINYTSVGGTESARKVLVPVTCVVLNRIEGQYRPRVFDNILSKGFDQVISVEHKGEKCCGRSCAHVPLNQVYDGTRRCYTG